MEKSVAALIGAMGALAVAAPAHAATVQASLATAMQVNSYADLLKPIPNATALRQALAESRAAEPAEPELLPVQYYYRHHHHHHRWYRRYHHHHHHHHHRHGFGIIIR
ncbi:MAG: hypothetical protein JO264_09720 [Acidisphaera sp.]|nr:hypothetical protein [Acidisphaera sp.]